MKKFDLNIEKILENWEIYHGIREIIANALDEQKLTQTPEIKIFKDINNRWHIRDYGRGITIEHFTQNENEEKLCAEGIIGKFGIGLKDALATFDRNNIDVNIISKDGEFTIGKSIKEGFNDIITLHIYINPPSDKAFVGTEFILSKIDDIDIQKAKNMFLNFSDEQPIEKCIYGMVLNKNYNVGRIYINGVKVAEEDNFLFSYNITNLNAAIRKALNRERTNVGRTAYATTIKSILLNCKSRNVATALVNDFKNYSSGTIHDELNWIDVQEHAVKMLNNYEKVVFVTTDEIASSPDLIDEVKSGGFTIVNIPTNLKEKIRGQSDIGGNIIREFNQFKIERNENFEFEFIQIEKLSQLEKQNYNLLEQILGLIGGKPSKIRKILISETMQRDNDTFSPTDGLCQENQIIIKRSVFHDTERFVAVLLHEIAHARSGATDSTRAFENELTSMLGIIGFNAIKTQQKVIEKAENLDVFEQPDYSKVATTNITPEDLRVIAGQGLYYMERGIRTFADWSKQMIKDIGDEIRPYLRIMYDDINVNYERLIKARDKNSSEVTPEGKVEDKTNGSQKRRSMEEIDASIKQHTAKLIAALTQPNAKSLSEGHNKKHR